MDIFIFLAVVFEMFLIIIIIILIVNVIKIIINGGAVDSNINILSEIKKFFLKFPRCIVAIFGTILFFIYPIYKIIRSIVMIKKCKSFNYLNKDILESTIDGIGTNVEYISKNKFPTNYYKNGKVYISDKFINSTDIVSTTQSYYICSYLQNGKNSFSLFKNIFCNPIFDLLGLILCYTLLTVLIILCAGFVKDEKQLSIIMYILFAIIILIYVLTWLLFIRIIMSVVSDNNNRILNIKTWINLAPFSDSEKDTICYLLNHDYVLDIYSTLRFIFKRK